METTLRCTFVFCRLPEPTQHIHSNTLFTPRISAQCTVPGSHGLPCYRGLTWSAVLHCTTGSLVACGRLVCRSQALAAQHSICDPGNSGGGHFHLQAIYKAGAETLSACPLDSFADVEQKHPREATRCSWRSDMTGCCRSWAFGSHVQ